DATLGLILRNVFRRARLSAAQWRRGELPGDSATRAVAGLLLLGAVAAAPLGFVVPFGWLATPGLAAVAVALDAGTYRSFFARRGPLVGLYFSAIHPVVTLTGAAGGAIGALQRVLSRRPAATAGRSR